MKKFQLTRKTFLIICNFILICLLIYFYAWEFFQDYVETLEIFEENPNQGVLTKKINCRDFSDLTSFCLYENICVENDEILYLTNDKKLYNIPFEYQGFIRQWDHYESTYKNGSVVNDKLNNPLPYRSFLKGKYVSSKKWNRSKIHHEDCRAIVGFDWKFGDNIFHFASKISTLFLFQYYNKHENFCKRFSHIKLMDRNSTEISEWQRNFYELASGVKLNENNTEFGNEPKRNQPKLQCYKYLFVAGNLISMKKFTFIKKFKLLDKCKR
ncbi:unnamed protein product [Brachionus calyciflorus]|uniref:Uncharacterized protein n=1 Tax=Brachionus calyciflorus TaxID=104777 RepID=A0A814KU24_9BILA|nr:unnamed protein product [Brachionus calyciflorus]